MIIPNGFISFKVKGEAVIDPDTGYASAPSFSWGEPIPCQWKATLYDLQATSSASATVKQSYSILIDEQPAPSEQIRLTDLKGDVIGEFSLRHVENLSAVCQTRLVI